MLYLDRDYMFSYNFNRNKTVGVRTVPVGAKTLVEAVVQGLFFDYCGVLSPCR